jgi:glycosyltransferase involved in cell wall biosynthesis
MAALDVPVVPLPATPRLRHVHRWREPIASLAGAIEGRGAEVVHANGEKMSIFAGWAARRARRPCVFWLHDAPGANGVSGRLAQAAMRATPRAAVVGCTAWVAEAFSNRLRLPATAITNGLDLEALPARVDPSEARAPFRFAPDAVVVVHAARLQRWKGTDVFLRAAARLPQELRFLVVGGALYGREVPWAEGLRRLASSLGLDGRVAFTGYRPDALRLMAAGDIVAHCSVAPDPFPTVVLEGMALGKAVVATRTRGPEEALEEGRTGLLVLPGDDAALAEAIGRLAADAAGRASMGEAARAVAHERFSARRMAMEFEDLYRSLTGAPALRR